MATQSEQSKSPESCDLDAHILAELASEIHSDRAVERMHAVSVLGRFGTGAGALQALKELTTDDPDPDVRRLARQSYDRLKGRVVEPLISEMRLRPQPEKVDLERLREFIGIANPIYRIEAVLQVLEARDKAALPLILERLEREKDEWVVATLVRAVGELGEKSHAPLITPFLEWEDQPRIIANAIEALGRLDVHGFARDIARMVDNRDPRVQAAAVVALFPIDAPAARVCLAAMAGSSRLGSRAAAAHCLAKLSDPESVAMLKQMAADEPDADLRNRMQAQLDGTGRHL